MTTITSLRCEYRPNPLGIDVTLPRLSWQMQTDRPSARQIAYRVRAARDPALLNTGNADLWDSGRVDSDQSVHVVYAGQPLQSRQRVHWSVTVWDETGSAAQSETAWFEMGLLQRCDWQAGWIGAALRGAPRSMIPAPHLRKTFSLPAGVTSARLYVTALGVYECAINGQRVGTDVLTPGWTDYDKHIQYAVYDVTALLRDGENVLGAVLGDGWAVGHVGWAHRQQYADRPRLLAQLEITAGDQRIVIVSDTSWRYAFGPITSNDLLMGEEYDARLELPGWDSPDYDDSAWQGVQCFDAPNATLVATNGPTIQRIEELTPISDPIDLETMDTTRHVFDLGQNIVGRVRFRGGAPEGTTITLRYAEALNPDGTIYTSNLRSARATDYYTFKDDGEITWEPSFTFHGFRYVELLGYPGKVSRETITGVVLHSAMQVTGEFTCSDPLVNQLQRNILWGQKGNFVDVPTDCPQRDERLGWTGDIQVFVRTAAFNMDVAGFMSRWAQDVADAQDEQGVIPPVVPKMKTPFLRDGGPAWSDAAVICPWTIYLCYGDRRILETQYPVMQRFMDYLLATSPGGIRCAPEYDGWHGFGDWLSINACTPRDLIGTAFLAYDAHLMAQIAAVLGKHDDAATYRALFESIKAAFGERFLVGSSVTAASAMPSTAWKRQEEADRISQGSLKTVDYGPVSTEVFNDKLFTPTQTAYVLALHFDLLPNRLRATAARELVADIARRGGHLSTGFVGSPYLPHVLSENGHLDSAYALLEQQTWPSWLYAVTQGATTIWERWDGWTAENGFQSPAMNSFNHYAYGAIGAWLYATVAGIDLDPAQPGYKHSLLRPRPGGSITSAQGKLTTLYGDLVSQWELRDGIFDWTVVIPPNTTATACLPVSASATVTLNGTAVNGNEHHLSAGRYHIVAEWRA